MFWKTLNIILIWSKILRILSFTLIVMILYEWLVINVCLRWRHFGRCFKYSSSFYLDWYRECENECSLYFNFVSMIIFVWFIFQSKGIILTFKGCNIRTWLTWSVLLLLVVSLSTLGYNIDIYSWYLRCLILNWLIKTLKYKISVLWYDITFLTVILIGWLSILYSLQTKHIKDIPDFQNSLTKLEECGETNPLYLSYFGPGVYPMGSLVIALVR